MSNLWWLGLVGLALIIGTKLPHKQQPRAVWIDVEVVHKGETITFWVKQNENTEEYGRSSIDTTEGLKVSSKFAGVGLLKLHDHELTPAEMEMAVMSGTVPKFLEKR